MGLDSPSHFNMAFSQYINVLFQEYWYHIPQSFSSILILFIVHVRFLPKASYLVYQLAISFRILDDNGSEKLFVCINTF